MYNEESESEAEIQENQYVPEEEDFEEEKKNKAHSKEKKENIRLLK